jgi:hypothetical protein
VVVNPLLECVLCTILRLTSFFYPLSHSALLLLLSTFTAFVVLVVVVVVALALVVVSDRQRHTVRQ